MTRFRVRNTRDGSRTLVHPDFDQTFHSVHGAYTESMHVFLEASGITRCLSESKKGHVLEVGFGTGLNFLLTADFALEQQATLTYTALDLQLYPPDILRQLEYDRWLKQPDLWSHYLSFLSKPGPIVPNHPLQWIPYDTIMLDFIPGDARLTLPEAPEFDAIYLDAFSPDANQELWSISFFEQLRPLLKQGGRLTTYSAKSLVRRHLAQTGFSVEKIPGPPGKREMIVAQAC